MGQSMVLVPIIVMVCGELLIMLYSITKCYEGSPEARREYIHVQDAARASVAALSEEFRNQHVVLTGQESMCVLDMLKI